MGVDETTRPSNFFLMVCLYLMLSLIQAATSIATQAFSTKLPLSDDAIQSQYLNRIGIPTTSFQHKNHKATMASLQQLLSAHLLAVPFENMDQHSHPEDPSQPGKTPFVARRSPHALPSLYAKQSLYKICYENRGGFCFELNLSFVWLLRSLGYKCRLALADVGAKQEIPGHVVILVDGLFNNDVDATSSVLVDVGFGTPGVCKVLLPVRLGVVVQDPHDDEFWFESDDSGSSRFDTVLYRKRVSNPEEREVMYRFHLLDDLNNDAEDFAAGLHNVLTKSPMFNEKRLCVLSTNGGHITLGEGYVKWVERGEVVKIIKFGGETDWREALEDHFGVTLKEEMEGEQRP